MSWEPTEVSAFPVPPEGFCNELFLGEICDKLGVIAPLYKWYYCRLPKGHSGNDHSCYAFRMGK